MTDEIPPDASPAAQSIKLRALVAASMLVAIFLLILQATPPFESRPKPSPFSPLSDREPEIRVRVATLEPGQDLAVAGGERGGKGGVKLVNRNGTLEIGGEPIQLPKVLNAPKDGDLAIGDRRYRGDLVVVKDPGTARLHFVNRLGIEAYLEGVVLSEMPPDYPDEALMAQAVASRSYAAWQILVRKEREFDVTDSQRSQVYKGAPRESALARRIVNATRGQVLVFDGKVLEAVFSSTCGGTTRSAEEAFGDESPPPLRGVTCGLCDGTQFSTWSARAKRTEAGKTLGLPGPVSGLSEETFHKSGRLAQITVHAAGATRKLTGNQLRDVFGPAGRSSWFTRIDLSGDWLVAEGRGFGHGAGMCQVGASKLAHAGAPCRTILARYYPDATIGWLYPPHEG